MSLTVPTTQNVSDTIVAQLSSSFGQSVPILPKSFIRVLAKVFAGVAILLYKYCGFIFLQLFVPYASFAPTTINGQTFSPLVAWGRLIGIGDPEPASSAQLSISVKITNPVGTLPANTNLVFPATGVIYQTSADVALTGLAVSVNIHAVSDQAGGDGSGAIGNLQPGDIVEFANTPNNVSDAAVVFAVVVTGADAETPDAYRARVVKRFRAQPQGGAPDDYTTWADAVPGIINAYVFPGFPGEVNVYCEADIVSSGSPDGIPTGPQLAAVAAYINALDPVSGVASRRPVNVAVNALPITRTAFGVRVNNLDSPDQTPDMRLHNLDSPAMTSAKIALAIAVDEHFRSLECFVPGVSTEHRDTVSQASVSGVVNDAVSALGVAVSSVDLLEGGALLFSRQLQPGEKAKLISTGPVYS